MQALSALPHELRYAARSLRRNPGFTCVVALTLAIGTALAAVAFSVYRAVALRPLEVGRPGEIVRVSSDRTKISDPFSFEEYERLQAGMRSLSAVIATSEPELMAERTAGAPEPRSASVVLASDNYFTGLGVSALYGRTFSGDERSVVVISYAAWRAQFNGDPSALGQTISLQGVPLTIIGITPERFGGTGVPPIAPDFWVPAAEQPRLLPGNDWLHDPSSRVWQVLGRRRPGFAPSQVTAEADIIASTWEEPDGKIRHLSAHPATYFELHGPEVHAAGMILLAAIILILVVGCVNVVNLVSAHNAARAGELGVRLSLGASRPQLLRQLAVESVLLGALGGLVGYGMAAQSCAALHLLALRAVGQISGGAFGVFLDLTPDAAVMALCIGVATTAALITNLVPAWSLVQLDLITALKHQGLAVAGRFAKTRGRALLGIQIGASCLLLAGAGVLFRGAARAMTVDPGFDASHVAVVIPQQNEFGRDPATRLLRLQEAADRLRASPEVMSVSWTDRAPFLGHSIGSYRSDGDRWVQGCVSVHADAEYLRTLGLPLAAGRGFTRYEAESEAPVAVISESAARAFWPAENAIGRVLYPARRPGTPVTGYVVVGVVKDARLTLLSKVDRADIFLPGSQPYLWLVRTRPAARAALPSILNVLRGNSAAPQAPALVMDMETGPMELQRLMAQAPAAFASVLGVVALVLAAVGVFGVVSYAVERRTREIGIRMALGAERASVIGLILRETLRPAMAGMAVGSAGAVGLSLLLTRLILNPELPDLTYGMGALPLGTYAATAALLGGTLLAAALIPGSRAASVDPVIALRTE